ncbi:hypothetical protein HDU76_004898 [Blyttiomyces sp. JEL0837]|nr:hypothetical protein HDU76_004898 [Blyttiomyces sp. JEL0837]
MAALAAEPALQRVSITSASPPPPRESTTTGPRPPSASSKLRRGSMTVMLTRRISMTMKRQNEALESNGGGSDYRERTSVAGRRSSVGVNHRGSIGGGKIGSKPNSAENYYGSGQRVGLTLSDVRKVLKRVADVKAVYLHSGKAVRDNDAQTSELNSVNLDALNERVDDVREDLALANKMLMVNCGQKHRDAQQIMYKVMREKLNRIQKHYRSQLDETRGDYNAKLKQAVMMAREQEWRKNEDAVQELRTKHEKEVEEKKQHHLKVQKVLRARDDEYNQMKFMAARYFLLLKKNNIVDTEENGAIDEERIKMAGIIEKYQNAIAKCDDEIRELKAQIFELEDALERAEAQSKGFLSLPQQPISNPANTNGGGIGSNSVISMGSQAMANTGSGPRQTAAMGGSTGAPVNPSRSSSAILRSRYGLTPSGPNTGKGAPGTAVMARSPGAVGSRPGSVMGTTVDGVSQDLVPGRATSRNSTASAARGAGFTPGTGARKRMTSTQQQRGVTPFSTYAATISLVGEDSQWRMDGNGEGNEDVGQSSGPIYGGEGMETEDPRKALIMQLETEYEARNEEALAGLRTELENIREERAQVSSEWEARFRSAESMFDDSKLQKILKRQKKMVAFATKLATQRRKAVAKVDQSIDCYITGLTLAEVHRKQTAELRKLKRLVLMDIERLGRAKEEAEIRRRREERERRRSELLSQLRAPGAAELNLEQFLDDGSNAGETDRTLKILEKPRTLSIVNAFVGFSLNARNSSVNNDQPKKLRAVSVMQNVARKMRSQNMSAIESTDSDHHRLTQIGHLPRSRRSSNTSMNDGHDSHHDQVHPLSRQPSITAPPETITIEVPSTGEYKFGDNADAIVISVDDTESCLAKEQGTTQVRQASHISARSKSVLHQESVMEESEPRSESRNHLSGIESHESQDDSGWVDIDTETSQPLHHTERGHQPHRVHSSYKGTVISTHHNSERRPIRQATSRKFKSPLVKGLAGVEIPKPPHLPPLHMGVEGSAIQTSETVPLVDVNLCSKDDISNASKPSPIPFGRRGKLPGNSQSGQSATTDVVSEQQDRETPIEPNPTPNPNTPYQHQQPITLQQYHHQPTTQLQHANPPHESTIMASLDHRFHIRPWSGSSSTQGQRTMADDPYGLYNATYNASAMLGIGGGGLGHFTTTTISTDGTTVILHNSTRGNGIKQVQGTQLLQGVPPVITRQYRNLTNAGSVAGDPPNSTRFVPWPGPSQPRMPPPKREQPQGVMGMGVSIKATDKVD